ncbi:hypothetical protein AXI70_gp30 [Cronobacter phage Dev-CD-23823]|uniref:Uncharacterized protein n=1 Tax=Cronobacter phage Dev-CD-23823 TaxID=1712539 RepID=A0A0K8IY22_9CAUD|nr:hypothetical protein AXI70_gp30 [Cronobacter phage Dev-CD-23823]CUH74605.1 hypothetical protein [Cronobacter phage Dev-CD-23823]
MSKPEQKVELVHRLTPEAYKQLESILPKPTVPDDGIRAAYNLGIQYVLRTLREGFVTE